MKLLKIVMLVSLLLLWAPASVQGLSSGALTTACETFTPQHGVSSQLFGLSYTLSVRGLLLDGDQSDQTSYVPDQIYTSELVLCACVYVVGQ